MNAERCLLAGEALGLGYAALRRAAHYTSERVVFGRPIAMNQAIQHPLADSWCQLEAAKMMTCGFLHVWKLRPARIVLTLGRLRGTALR